MKIKFFALSVLAALSIGSAQAEQIWGVHTPTEFSSFAVSYNSFYDKFFYF